MDNRRQKIRETLSDLYLPYYDALCAKLPEEWQPYCGLRSPEDQDKVLQSKNSRAARWESPHNYGCASDWCLWIDDKPVWPAPDDERWDPYVQACISVGLQPGGLFRSFKDFPHNEYKIFVSWKMVGAVYGKYGLDRAMLFIKQVHTE